MVWRKIMTDKAKIEPAKAWGVVSDCYNVIMPSHIHEEKAQAVWYACHYNTRPSVIGEHYRVIPVLITPMETDNADE
jgi:hypothetical protein